MHRYFLRPWINNPFSSIDPQQLLDWCSVNVSVRVLILAELICPYTMNEDKKELRWTNLSLSLLELAPDPVILLNKYTKFFNSYYCLKLKDENLSDCMQKRLTLISQLKRSYNGAISDWSIRAESIYERLIQKKKEEERVRKEINNIRFHGFESDYEY